MPAQRRFLHLYTGQGYTVTQDYINRLDGLCFTDFIIHLGYHTKSTLKSSQSASERTNIINQSISDLDKFLDMHIKSPLFQNNNDNIWISTPHIDPESFANAIDFQRNMEDFMSRAVELVMKKDINLYNRDFQGFNFRTEAAHPNYQKIDASNPVSNQMVRLMNNMAYYVRNTVSRQFMWNPYYGTGTLAENVIHNVGVITNRTNIFDFVLIQPSYYFNPTEQHKINLSRVRTSAKDKAVVDINGNPVAGGRASYATAKIGVIMEVDNDGIPGKSKNAIYEECRKELNPLVMDRTIPIAWYAGTPDNISNVSKLRDLITAFWNY
ncbi:hypothetical protein ACQCN2_19610 [Brevibacillus ginsengisoli]|uniref:hypothetical protein n=1 Tax=Brevibacillus ginsengisoli TaxID=363854 RepID=UPI003CF51C8A